MMVAWHNITKLVGTAIAVAALGVTTPGTAAAYTTADFAFLRKVFADGVNFGEPDDIIQRARWSATRLAPAIADGRSRGVLSNSAFAPRQAAVFMADAPVLLPRYAELFIS